MLAKIYENFKIISETLAKNFGLAFIADESGCGGGGGVMLGPRSDEGALDVVSFSPPSTSEKISSSSDAKPDLKEKVLRLCTGKVVLEP